MDSSFWLGLGTGLLPGVIVGSATGFAVYFRMVNRFRAAQERLEAHKAAELARDRSVTGRTGPARENAGPPARFGTMLPTRPGRQTLNHMARKRIPNLPLNQVDSQGNRSSVSGVRKKGRKTNK